MYKGSRVISKEGDKWTHSSGVENNSFLYDLSLHNVMLLLLDLPDLCLAWAVVTLTAHSRLIDAHMMLTFY